jgi:hypothetical protein
MHRPRLAVPLGCAAALACACASSPAPDTVEVVVVTPAAPAAPGVAAGAPARAKGSLLGHWNGNGRQSDGPTWPLEIDVTSLDEGKCATAAYPSLDCTAEWECLEASNGRSIRAVERITKGVERCIDGGTMILELSDDGDAASWQWEEDDSEITAHAHLQRGRAAPPAKPKPR